MNISKLLFIISIVFISLAFFSCSKKINYYDINDKIYTDLIFFDIEKASISGYNEKDLAPTTEKVTFEGFYFLNVSTELGLKNIEDNFVDQTEFILQIPRFNNNWEERDKAKQIAFFVFEPKTKKVYYNIVSGSKFNSYINELEMDNGINVRSRQKDLTKFSRVGYYMQLEKNVIITMGKTRPKGSKKSSKPYFLICGIENDYLRIKTLDLPKKFSLSNNEKFLRKNELNLRWRTVNGNQLFQDPLLFKKLAPCMFNFPIDFINWN